MSARSWRFFAVFVAIVVLGQLVFLLRWSAAVRFRKISPYATAPKGVITLPTSADALTQDWFALPVTKGEGMFSPLYLPFSSRAEGVEADPHQSLAFPALLRFKFDFVPDNFSNTPPEELFRDDPEMAGLTLKDTTRIVDYLKQWKATHALAGEVVATPKGYTGKLVVLDTTGTQVFSREYSAPLPYFTLMGRMVEDWMAYRKQPVSPWLRQELERPMTTKMETVRWYGETLTVPKHAKELLPCYKKILAADADFAEVRHLRADEQTWHGQEDTDFDSFREKRRAALSHPVMEVFPWIQSGDDTAEGRRYEALRARVKRELPTHCRFIEEKVRDVLNPLFTPEATRAAMDKQLPLTQRYQSYWPLLHLFADYYFSHRQYEKGLPLCVSAARSGWGSEGQSMGSDWYHAGLVYWATGHPGAALYCMQAVLQQPGEEGREAALLALPAIYRDFLDYKQARITAQQAFEQTQGHPRALLLGYLIAYERGKPGEGKALAQGYPATMGRAMEKLFAAREALSAGRWSKVDVTLNSLTWKDFTDSKQLEASAVQEWAALLDEYAIRQGAALPGKGKDRPLPAWAYAPCTPRMGHLLQLARMKKAPQEIARYAEVMTWIAPEVPYWQELLTEAHKAGAREETGKEIERQLYEITEHFAKIRHSADLATTAWRSQTPLQPEYLLLRTAQLKDTRMLQAALFIFAVHTFSVGDGCPSDAYQAHLRCFWHKLKPTLPKGPELSKQIQMVEQAVDYLDPAVRKAADSPF